MKALLLSDGVSIDITSGGWRESSRRLAVAARASIAWRNPQLIQGMAR
jgi:hypothetical protein